MGNNVVVLSTHRPTRRQVSRAMTAGGLPFHFFDAPDAVAKAMDEAGLVILDGDNTPADSIRRVLDGLTQVERRIPVIVLSLAEDKSSLVELLRSYDLGNLVAKHGAIRAVHPVVDERELLVTCNKVLTKEIFGVEKYVGLWGVLVHRRTITSMGDKSELLDELEMFVRDLDCPATIIPDIVAVAEELVINAVVHAPRLPNGESKYEQLGPQAQLTLEPGEYVDVTWVCDGQKLMLAVADNFGALNKATVLGYLARGMGGEKLTCEQKASGAGLGLTMAFRNLHQLIFNIHETHRTEAIAGWYLRVNTAAEFRQVSKSLNVFWLGRNDVVASWTPLSTSASETAPPARAAPRPAPAAATLAGMPLVVTQSPENNSQVAMLSGRIDENTNLTLALRAQRIDLRRVTGITSRGVVRWLRFVESLGQRTVEVVAMPEVMVRVASEVKGATRHLAIRTVLAPYACGGCGTEDILEVLPATVSAAPTAQCGMCGGALVFTGDEGAYQSLAMQA